MPELDGPILTLNQVVATNLRRARALRGLSQAQAAALVSGELGETWSAATYSAAETSADPEAKRIRLFDADLLYALARAFRLPIAYFLLPGNAHDQIAPASRRDAPDRAVELLAALFPAELPGEWEPRVRQLFSDWTADVPVSKGTEAYLGKIADMRRMMLTTIECALRDELGDVDGWISNLQVLLATLSRARDAAVEVMDEELAERGHP